MLVYNLFMGLTTYLYRGYNPFTKYHGHPNMASYSLPNIPFRERIHIPPWKQGKSCSKAPAGRGYVGPQEGI